MIGSSMPNLTSHKALRVLSRVSDHFATSVRSSQRSLFVTSFRAAISTSSSSPSSPSSPANMSVSTEAEKLIQRNPHPDFKKVEGSRPDFESSAAFTFTKTPQPDWKHGGGSNALPNDGQGKKHISIDPYEPGRPAPFNYKLLISSIVPRPIGFVSSQSPDGGEQNLAPFSYFNMINHDPPLFALGLAASLERPKDTLKNLVESRECVVSIISEHFVEAANATSIDAPYGVSEWDISGLTPLRDCKDVKAARVGEAVFSAECKVESIREFESKATPGKKTGCLVVLEATRFWVREDAINEERNLIDPGILAPVSRLGGITYGRTVEAYELPRPVFEKDVGGLEGYEALKKRNAEKK
ncbi:2-nitrobenzoate nitroreductase [Microdochium nivale]|nr:2-nitrobenzoate nitroreductase [Microdochium nivale]